jgi:hypothetical protein
LGARQPAPTRGLILKMAEGMGHPLPPPPPLNPPFGPIAIWAPSTPRLVMALEYITGGEVRAMEGAARSCPPAPPRP